MIDRAPLAVWSVLVVEDPWLVFVDSLAMYSSGGSIRVRICFTCGALGC